MKRKIAFALAVIITVACLLSLNLGVFAAEPTDEMLIGDFTEWRYLDDGSDPGLGLNTLSSWTQPSFNDSYWKKGYGSFGTKSGAIASINGKVPDNLITLYQEDGTSLPTAFFRANFTVSDLSKNNTLVFDAYADDSVVIYINGTVVRDSRGTVNSTTNLYYSSGVWEQSFDVKLYEYDSLIREGENTIAVELHNTSSTSSDLYFGIESMVLTYKTPVEIPAELITLNAGADETKRNLAWFSNVEDIGEVRLAPAAEVVNGVFPDEYETFTPASRKAVNIRARYARTATLSGLEESTRYAYVIEAGGALSEVHYFETQSFDSFNFVLVGDPQLSKQSHGSAWKDTVDKITNELDTSFIISAGDQVNRSDAEDFYSYFVIDEMAGITLAPSVGPGHESESATFTDHYNLPNLSAEYGVSTAAANYWYKYNNTLFMHLNTSDTDAASNGEHRKFMEEAMMLNPDVKWNIVVMHVSLYSTGPHTDDSSVLTYRRTLAPIFSELKIDAVISGHDHVYVRSHMMNGNAVGDDEVINNEVFDPKGVLYVCANSSTGSKFYDQEVEADFAAFDNYEERKSAVKFEITNEYIKMTSYFLDDMSEFDSFTIYKEDHICKTTLVPGKPAGCSSNGKREYYLCDCGRAYEDADSTVRVFNLKSWSVIESSGHKWVAATCTHPRMCEICGAGKGELVDHEFAEATCLLPPTCISCGATEGEALGHDYENGCDATCSVCSESREVGEHADSDGDKLCDECRAKVEAQNGDFPIVAVILICASAFALIAVAIVIVKVKKSKSATASTKTEQ